MVLDSLCLEWELWALRNYTPSNHKYCILLIKTHGFYSMLKVKHNVYIVTIKPGFLHVQKNH